MNLRSDDVIEISPHSLITLYFDLDDSKTCCLKVISSIFVRNFSCSISVHLSSSFKINNEPCILSSRKSLSFEFCLPVVDLSNTD